MLRPPGVAAHWRRPDSCPVPGGSGPFRARPRPPRVQGNRLARAPRPRAGAPDYERPRAGRCPSARKGHAPVFPLLLPDNGGPDQTWRERQTQRRRTRQCFVPARACCRRPPSTRLGSDPLRFSDEAGPLAWPGRRQRDPLHPARPARSVVGSLACSACFANAGHLTKPATSGHSAVVRWGTGRGRG